MLTSLLILLVIQLIACVLLFKTMLHRRKTFQERFATTMTTFASIVLGLNLSMLAYLLLGVDYRAAPIITIGLGMILGISFGSMFKFQSAFAGFYHGTSGSVMGTMLGAVITNPELCGLPAATNTNYLAFGIFGAFVSLTSALLLSFSLKV